MGLTSKRSEETCGWRLMLEDISAPDADSQNEGGRHVEIVKMTRCGLFIAMRKGGDDLQ